ncbi:MAG: hypothetical protein PHF86_12450 [Candidatus Nanoarchaeia archaeon]|nr:hypothetical protein [Candidatus Nanoarchaeia archaeon]
MRCKNKVFLRFVVGIFLLLTLSSIVSSADIISSTNITIAIPTASGIMKGASAWYNATLITGYEAQNWTRSRVYLQSASLGTTTLYVGSYTINQSDLEFNGTIDTNQVYDATDYTITVQLWNGTTYVNNTRSGITIDNGVPVAPTSLLPTSDTDGTVNFSATVVDANVTACTIYFVNGNPGSSSYTMVYSGSGCSYNMASVPEKTYTWYVSASDGSNSTISSTKSTEVDVASLSGTAGAIFVASEEKDITGARTLSLAGEGTVGSTAIGWIIGIAVFIAIIVGIILYLKKK